jgi:hypothetical protein
MQMQFTRFRPKKQDGDVLRGAASARELAVAQLLGLASSAGFRFDPAEGGLVSTSEAADWGLWPALRACLDDIGAEAVIAYFEQTTPDQHSQLSASAT